MYNLRRTQGKALILYTEKYSYITHIIFVIQIYSKYTSYTGPASEAGKLKVPNFFMKHLLSEFFLQI